MPVGGAAARRQAATRGACVCRLQTARCPASPAAGCWSKRRVRLTRPTTTAIRTRPARLGPCVAILPRPLWPTIACSATPPASDIDGFGLHAAVRVEAHERTRLEQLCRTITRPALSDDRFQLNGAGLLRSVVQLYPSPPYNRPPNRDCGPRLIVPPSPRETCHARRSDQ